jgi:hypothetical protein
MNETEMTLSAEETAEMLEIIELEDRRNPADLSCGCSSSSCSCTSCTCIITVEL